MTQDRLSSALSALPNQNTISSPNQDRQHFLQEKTKFKMPLIFSIVYIQYAN
jgi:hypothetical protein